MRKPRIGLICVGLNGERNDLAQGFLRKAIESLKKNDIEIACEILGVTLNWQDVQNQTQTIIKADADAVIYMPGTWVIATHVADAVRKLTMPVAIWGIPEASSFSSVGANVVHGMLDEIGFKHKLFYGMPDDTDTTRSIYSFVRAAMVVKELQGSHLGLIGGRSLGAYPTAVDPNQVKKIFGIEIDHIDQMVLLEKARGVKTEVSQELYQEFIKIYGKINVPQEVMIKSLNAYVALKDIIKERKLDFVALKCLEEFINTYTSCCVAISLTNNDGIITACQSDINAAISMQISKLLSDKPVIFADVNMVDKDNKVVRLINCGTMSTDLAKDKKTIDWEYQYEYMGAGRGACPVFCCKEGRVTFISLGRLNGEYIMHISTGIAFERPKEVFAEARDIWPHAFIQIDGDPIDFYTNLRSNHVVVGYGDMKNDLTNICYLLDMYAAVNKKEPLL